MTDRRVLLTGGSGFVGRQIVAALGRLGGQPARSATTHAHAKGAAA